ncbi:hypothetical protein [Chitiniphilus eburneus]|uniref:Uncharacterized protein n=1 Tax=Chitiniphilus eburneus TaxID=2571148 RepID=A0A4U0PY59_9NEIS|nr:hypothetical protein [Chitiniphilus eburneus]TJZ73190.1 hypothetical protein FAZ21_11270 [Chitiniphilus eburneus]
MPILSGNIKFLATQVMADVPEGGGRPVNTVIPDGASNAIFDDISEIARAGGQVSLRKVALSVQTADVAGYYGANLVLSRVPSDPRVSVAMFSTGDLFDYRDAAKSRVEAYLFAGPEWGGHLLENHIAGQSVIQILQRPGTPVPVPGQTLVLIVDEGKAGELVQYVRVIRVTSTLRTFTASEGSSHTDFQALVVSCELSDTLRSDFVGSPPTRTYSRNGSAAKIRETVVADAARYYGVSALTAPTSIGDLSVDVASIWTQLVPSAQTDVPIADASPAGTLVALQPTTPAAVTLNSSAQFGPANALYVGPLLPGSLSINSGSVTLTDQDGRLMAGSAEVGAVDYASGVITVASGGNSYGGTKSITLRPAATPAQVSETIALPVTIESRSATLSLIVDPVPAPATLTLSYMAQGRWYVLQERGSGRLAGSDVSHGAGTLSFLTGALVVTLGALPDVGSSILLGWGRPQLSAEALAPHAVQSYFEWELGGPVYPGTLALSWTDGAARSVTDNGNGALTGYGSGTVDYATGQVVLTPTVLPPPTTPLQITWSDVAGEDIRPPTRADVADYIDAATAFRAVLADAAVLPGSFEGQMLLTWPTGGLGTPTVTYHSRFRVRDNGSGGLLLDLASGAVPLTGGSIDYATGEITVPKSGTLPVPYTYTTGSASVITFGD